MLPAGNTVRRTVRSTRGHPHARLVTGRSAVVTIAVVETLLGLILAAAGAVVAAPALGTRRTLGTDRWTRATVRAADRPGRVGGTGRYGGPRSMIFQDKCRAGRPFGDDVGSRLFT
jgi:hypothetical protein